MRNREMLDRMYNAYNGVDVTYDEMVSSARQFIDQVFQCYSYHLDQPEKYKYFTIFCAWIAAVDGPVNMKEYEFFRKFSGLNVDYETFKRTGNEMYNNRKAWDEFKDLNKTKFRSGTMYDYTTHIIALCMCGCDGPLNSAERSLLDNYIRHPDYNPL